jgi:IstB-like ATP binding protein
MTDTPQLLLAHHLKALKLPTFLREYDKLARQCAAEGLDHIRFLLRLAELELIDRERRMVERRIKEARFPSVKSLDSFDFAAIPSLNKTLVLELARSEYVTRRENIIAVGNSGTGKTHIGLGLGLAACQKGLSVGFYTAAALVHLELAVRRMDQRVRFRAAHRCAARPAHPSRPYPAIEWRQLQAQSEQAQITPFQFRYAGGSSQPSLILGRNGPALGPLASIIDVFLLRPADASLQWR